MYVVTNKFKKEIILFIIFAFIYFALVIFANVLSNLIKIPNSINALSGILFLIGTIIFLKKKKLLSYYGINSLKSLNYKNLLYLIPIIIIPLTNLRHGININYSWSQIILISISMVGVGFSEEILFRGFLMKAIMNKNTKTAILVSSTIFGMFHLFNLISGANVVMTLLQVIYAISFGLMCSMFFYKTNNIIPCIICHIMTNITDIFLPEHLSIKCLYIGCVLFILPSAFYALYLHKTKKLLINDV